MPLLVLPFITRALSPEDYGAWVLAYAFGATASALANMGLPMIYERSYFESIKEGGSAALLWTTTAFVCGAVAAVLAITWLCRDAIAAAVMHDRPDTMLLFWTACAVCASSLKTYFLVYFRNEGEARRHALYTIQESVLGAAASVLLVMLLHSGAVGLAWGPLAAALVVLVQLCARFSQRLPLAFAWPPLRDSLRLALPLTPRVALGVFGQVFDKWLVGAVAATGGVAAYSIAQRLAYTVFTFSTALENVFQPKTYRLMFEGPANGSAVGRMLTPYAYATVGVALAVGLLADEALLILAPPSYAGASAITAILVMYFAIIFFGKQPQLLFAKKTGMVSLLSSAAIVLNALAMWVLAMRYGALGAAAGMALAGASTTLVFVLVSQRHYPIGYERGKLLLVHAFLVLSLLVVHVALRDAPLATLLLAKVVMLGAYVSIGAVFGYWQVLLRRTSPARAAAARS
jgi:O-antigen/teichoic acid export membrane protein